MSCRLMVPVEILVPVMPGPHDSAKHLVLLGLTALGSTLQKIEGPDRGQTLSALLFFIKKSPCHQFFRM